MNNYQFVIPAELEEERLDKCISSLIDTISRSYIQKIIKNNEVFVNDNPRKANYIVKEGDIVSFCLPDAIEPDIPAENIALDILYEDDDVLVVNKPKGMVVHPAAGHYNNTLVNAILYHCKGNLSGINGVMRPGIVHRIDKDTTGSVIICKNDFSHNIISNQLKEHTIIRKYRAIVYGNVKEESGTITTTIGRDPNNRKKMAANVSNGKNAVTHFQCLEHFNNYTYMEFRLETGRTHQIRVHMAHMKHPLVGDLVYGPQKDPFHTQGQVLHAMVLGFIHPKTQEYIETVAPLPEYFENLLDKLRKMQA